MRYNDLDSDIRDSKLCFASLSDTDKAYIAGLLDGEGCIRIARLSGRSTVAEGMIGIAVSCANTDRAVLEDLVAAFGGHLHGKPRPDREKHRLCWNWSVSGKRAAQVLYHVEPYLRIKRAEASAALLFAETYYGAWRVAADQKRLSDPARKVRRIVFSFFKNHAKSGRRKPNSQ